MIVHLIMLVLVASFVLMAGFYFLHFVRKENLGKSQTIVGNAVVVFSLLVIIAAFICGGVRMACGNCHGGSKSCSSQSAHCGKSDKCSMSSASCSRMESKSCCSKSSCEMDMYHGMTGSKSCSMGGPNIKIEKEIMVDDKGEKTIEIEVSK